MTETQIPPLADLLASARVVSLPLRAKFRGLLEREIVLFEGPNGWAEWAPFTEYDDAEAAVWLAAAIEFAYGQLPELQRTEIPVNATLPAVSATDVESVLSKFGQFRTVKIKVGEAGQTPDQDIDRIIAVRAAYPTAKIRLDANGAWAPGFAVSFAEAMMAQRINLEYLEQPCQTLAELKELKVLISNGGLPIKIAADESIRKASDPYDVARTGAADVLVLKAAPLGGITRALNIAEAARLPIVISSALDSSVGISMGAYLAAALPELKFDCGLGTAALLAGDVTREPLIPVEGEIPVRRVEVDESKLEVFRAEDHRADWWLERLERAYSLL